MALYLTPIALGYLTQLILAVLISGYFLWLALHSHQPRHGLWLTGFLVTFTAFIGTLFLEASLLPTPRLYSVFLQIPLLSIALICLLQFAYHFPALPASLRAESRLVLLLSSLYTLWECAYTIFRFARLGAGVVEFRPDWGDFLLLGFLLWPSVIFVRQMILLTPPHKRLGERLASACLHPPTREARALRAFAIIFLFVASLGLFNVLRTFYLLSVALANLGISIGILLALFAFTLAYLNQRSEATSFMIKLVGVTLTAMLAIMGIIGWIISPAYAALYQPDLTAPQALRFTPDARGGYDVAAIPYSFERDLGRDLQLDDGLYRGCSEALAFAFPFYGQVYREIYVCNDGAVALGQPVRYREFQYRYGAGIPLLLPLLMDLDPTISSGGVFARQEPDRLIVTWDRLRGFRRPEAEFTFQVVLYADGIFDFIYKTLPERLVFLPNDDPGAGLWTAGALPGSVRGSGPQITSFHVLPLQSGPEGVLQDYLMEFRQHTHRFLAPLSGLILAASVFIVIGFPLMFYISLVQPLNALLQGAECIEAGIYDVVVPVRSFDEIGVLTRVFNTLRAQVGDLIRNLESRVAARTAELDTVNAQLRAEMLEREEVQTLLIEQQSVLARFEEREALSRELHDGLGQVMGYINVQAQAAHTFLNEGYAEAAQNTLLDLIPVVQDAHTSIRAHILGLRAREMVPQDFLATVREYLKQFGERYHISVSLSVPKSLSHAVFAPAIEEQATRILHEGLTNVRKHAQAHRVEVVFSLVGTYVQMIIADDGLGFDMCQRISESADQHIDESHIAPSVSDTPCPASSDQPSALGPPGHFGLSIMRERAQQVGGTLEIRTAPGQGTRLLITLPRFQPADKGADGVMPQNVRLLLADDHPLFLDGLRTLLTARGLTVVGVAYDGDEVQEKVRMLRPDVVVMDVNMPKCDGITATRAIKKAFPEIKILVLTAAEDEAVLFEAIKSGASGYLLKNLDANQFCTTIFDLLRGEAPLAPGMSARILDEFARMAVRPALPSAEEAESLSAQQWEILGMVAEGIPYREIALKLHLSHQTIKYHMGQIIERLQLENRAQAIVYYQQTQE